MQPPIDEWIIDGLRYSTTNATLIATTDEQYRSQYFLYHTPKGRYFAVCCNHDTNPFRLFPEVRLILLDVNDAKRMYEQNYKNHLVEYSDAFPGENIEDA